MSGFGSPGGGFGAKQPAGFGGGGGFGAAAGGAGGFGKQPAAGGFGAAAPAAGGFGAKAPAAGGFGGGGGFGAQAPAAGGFGKGGFGTAGATGGGFGQQGQQQQGQQGVNPYAQPVGAAGSAVVGQYLLQWDNVYNADHPDCKFREFVYNMCTAGYGEHAIQREREGPRLRGAAGAKEEQWLIARRDNPDAENMYPAPVHFAVGLKARATKQKEVIAEYHERLSHMIKTLAELRALHDENEDRFEKLVLEESMVEGRLLIAAGRAEVLRQAGLKVGQERYTVAQRADALRRSLGSASTSLAELEGLAGDSAAVDSAVSDAANTIAACTSTTTMADWARAVDANENAIEKLQGVVRDDLRVVRAILQRMESAAA